MKFIFKSVSKGIESADIFGQGVGIRYNQKQFRKTKLGGFATLIIWSLISYQSYSVIKELVLQENPSVIQQINYVKQPESFQISPKTFHLAMGLQDTRFQHFNGEGIYNVKAFQYEFQRNINQNDGIESQKLSQYKEIEVEKCTSNHFQIEESQDYFQHLPYREMYCLKINQNLPYIEGEYAAEKFGFIEFQFESCQGDNCKNQTEIETKLIQPTLSIHFSDTYINLKSKQNPFISTGKNLFWTTGQQMEKDIFLNLINVKIQSDYSIIGSSYDTIQELQFSSEREISLPRTSNNLFRLTVMYLKNKEITYLRNYLKAGNALSQVGGFFNFFLTIGFILFRRFSQSDLNHKLINEVFDIRDDTILKEQKQDNNFKSQKNKLNSLQTSKQVQNNYENNNMESISTPNQSKLLKNVSKFQKNKGDNFQITPKKLDGEQIQFSLFNYICNVWRFWVGCKTSESNLINYATNKIFDHIDILNIIKKLIEVDKLKQLLLNEDQRKLFEYLPKPVLFLSRFDIKETNKQREQQIDLNVLRGSIIRLEDKQINKKTNSFEELKKSYQNITRLQQKSFIDERIIRMLDPSFKQQLQNEKILSCQSSPPNLAVIQPKSIFSNQNEDDYEESIIKLDDLNEIFKPKEIKCQNLKSMNSLIRHNRNSIQGFKVSKSIQIDDQKNQSVQ